MVPPENRFVGHLDTEFCKNLFSGGTVTIFYFVCAFPLEFLNKVE